MLQTQALKKIFPSLVWNLPSTEKILYLTFDDGPVPEVTPFVLQTLKEFQAKATFFCIGDNVKKNPEIFKSIIDQGHTTGNHTFHHLNGWQAPNKKYFEDVNACAQLVTSNLFRPPYGKIKPMQIRTLKKNFRIIMWDVLTGDYNPGISADECFQKSIRATRGSVIVFHDSIKAFPKLKTVLPKFLTHYSELNYSFKTIL